MQDAATPPTISELFPRTPQELVVWKLMYSDSFMQWRQDLAACEQLDPAQYTAVEAHMTEWLIDLDRRMPGTVVYSNPNRDPTNPNYTLDIAVEVAGVPIGLLWHRYHAQVIDHAYRLRLGDDEILIRDWS